MDTSHGEEETSDWEVAATTYLTALETALDYQHQLEETIQDQQLQISLLEIDYQSQKEEIHHLKETIQAHEATIQQLSEQLRQCMELHKWRDWKPETPPSNVIPLRRKPPLPPPSG